MLQFSRSVRSLRHSLHINVVRSLYTIPTIPHIDSLKDSGVQGLYSKDGLKSVWYDRAEQLVANLNYLRDPNLAEEPLSTLVSSTFKNSQDYGVFSYASILNNTLFSVETLKGRTDVNNEQVLEKPSAEFLLSNPSLNTTFNNEPTNPDLVEWINDSFGSIVEFRTLLLNSANAIKGDGYVWVVAKQSSYSKSDSSSLAYDNLLIMNTYNAGIVDDSLRSGQLDKLAKLKQNKQQEQSQLDEDEESLNKIIGSVEEAQKLVSYSQSKLLPVLAIDASPKAFLTDYGVFGKKKYLDNLWECIDWDVVANRLPNRVQANYFGL